MEVPQEIVTRYLQRRQKELTDCFQFLERQEFAKLEKVGHQLKGNGVTFGYSDLSKIGQELERAAQHEDNEAILLSLQSLTSWVRSRHA